MVKYEKFVLDNGLRLIIHKDPSTELVALNTLYDVGARDEDPNRTGFAHLFEHLMFGGSVNVPEFDKPLQNAGGQNNAFTNNDFTNYYITIPKENLDTALWLESDRMLNLAFTTESLEVQRKVVIEEFKQRYLNQPYGDVWLKLRPMAYKNHPYQWATIGKSIEHIEDATMEDVKDFFRRFYRPSNAILVIAGNVEVEDVKSRVEHWFGDIPSGEKLARKLPLELDKQESEQLLVKGDVPQNALYMAWGMPSRLSSDYYAADLITDLLSRGKSARLYQKLIKELGLFNSVSSYVLGSLDPGLLVVSGMLAEGVTFEDASKAVKDLIAELLEKGPEERELEKVKNKLETGQLVSEGNVLSKAMNLAFYELLGDAEGVNSYLDRYMEVSSEDIVRVGREIFQPNRLNELHYQKKDAK